MSDRRALPGMPMERRLPRSCAKTVIGSAFIPVKNDIAASNMPPSEERMSAFAGCVKPKVVRAACTPEAGSRSAGSKPAPVSQTVAVIDASRQHVGDGLNAAVRMPAKSRAIIFRTIVAEKSSWLHQILVGHHYLCYFKAAPLFLQVKVSAFVKKTLNKSGSYAPVTLTNSNFAAEFVRIRRGARSASNAPKSCSSYGSLA